MEVDGHADTIAGPVTAGALFQHVRSGAGVTRPDLARLTGLSRSTVEHRLEALLAMGLVVEDGEAPSTGGRKPGRLRFPPDTGVVLAADLGVTHARVAVVDLAGRVLADVGRELSVASGPDAVLETVAADCTKLLERVARHPADVRGLGVGLPGPVDHEEGAAVSPPIMPGWDGFAVPDYLGDRFGCPVLVDNDVNIMAIGEYWAGWRDRVEDLLFVKVGTGIGCGIVSGGRIRRGAQGAAGDLGHVRVSQDDAVCRCGNTGCIEAVASGQALANRLRELGHETLHARDVVALLQAGDAEATRLIRLAGRLLGEVLATAVSLFNPSVVVVGGDVARVNEHLLAGVREVVYQRSLPLATRHLHILPSRLGDHAGVRGAATMALEKALSPEAIDARIEALR